MKKEYVCISITSLLPFFTRLLPRSFWSHRVAMWLESIADKAYPLTLILLCSEGMAADAVGWRALLYVLTQSTDCNCQET